MDPSGGLHGLGEMCNDKTVEKQIDLQTTALRTTKGQLHKRNLPPLLVLRATVSTYCVFGTAFSIKHLRYSFSIQRFRSSISNTIASIQHFRYSNFDTAFSIRHFRYSIFDIYSIYETTFSIQHFRYSISDTAFSIQHLRCSILDTVFSVFSARSEYYFPYSLRGRMQYFPYSLHGRTHYFPYSLRGRM